MNFKEKIVITLFFFSIICFEMALNIFIIPTSKRYWIMFVCAITMIVPWIREYKVIHGKVKHIELWKTDEDKKMFKMIKRFGDYDKDVLIQVFHIKKRNISDRDYLYADYCLKFVFKNHFWFKRKDMVLYPHQTEAQYFKSDKGEWGVILNEENTIIVHDIIDDALIHEE